MDLIIITTMHHTSNLFLIKEQKESMEVFFLLLSCKETVYKKYLEFCQEAEALLVGWEQSPIDVSRPRLPKRQEAPLISTQRVDFEYLPNHCPSSPPDPGRRLVTHKSITSDTANPRYVGRTNPEYTVPGKLLYRISAVVRESIFNKIWDF